MKSVLTELTVSLVISLLLVLCEIPSSSTPAHLVLLLIIFQALLIWILVHYTQSA